MKGKIQVVPLIVIGLVVLILVYGYFLPSSDKCQIIPDLEECGGKPGTLLFSDSPGSLAPSDQAARYNLEEVVLFRRDSLDIATLFDEVSTKKSWFFSSSVKTDFEVQEGGKEVNLFIFVNEAEGKLKVKVNRKRIATLKGDGLHEVSVPLGILKDENIIELKSSTPLVPLTTNRYSLGKVVLREDYTITHNRIVRDLNLNEDIEDIERAILRFETDCFAEENLSVSINGVKLIDDRLCVGFEKDISEFLEDENEITFASEGNYFIGKLKLDVDTKQKAWTTNYFNIGKNRLDNLVNLKLMFNETGEKRLTIYLNKEPLSVETRKFEFETTVNKFLVEGQNSMILIPENEFILDKIELL